MLHQHQRPALGALADRHGIDGVDRAHRVGDERGAHAHVARRLVVVRDPLVGGRPARKRQEQRDRQHAEQQHGEHVGGRELAHRHALASGIDHAAQQARAAGGEGPLVAAAVAHARGVVALRHRGTTVTLGTTLDANASYRIT